MLTPKQLEQRGRGIGASEVPALVLPPSEVPGRRGMGVVWLTKRRGPKLELDPILAPEPEPDKCDAFAPYIRGDNRTAGSILESGLVQIYETITGFTCTPAPTEVHPEYPFELATPDRYVSQSPDTSRERGLECKLVGYRMAHDWPEDGIPDYVRIQCQWGMYVTGLERWDIMALIGGSEPRIIRVERDDALIGDLHEIVVAFWYEYVLGNKMPPASGPVDAMRIVRACFRGDDGVVVAAPPEAEELMRALAKAQAAEKAANEEADMLKAALCAIVQGHKGIEGPGGKFLWYGCAGPTRWKEVAQELAGGIVPDVLLEKHRGESYRTARLYSAKTGRAQELG